MPRILKLLLWRRRSVSVRRKIKRREMMRLSWPDRGPRMTGRMIIGEERGIDITWDNKRNNKEK